MKSPTPPVVWQPPPRITFGFFVFFGVAFGTAGIAGFLLGASAQALVVVAGLFAFCVRRAFPRSNPSSTELDVEGILGALGSALQRAKPRPEIEGAVSEPTETEPTKPT